MTLRHRDDGSIELRVNGVFVMDDVETSSEEELATAVIALGAREVLVGGLGLGFTLRALLESDQITQVTMVEREPQLVEWMTDGTIPGADLLADPRTVVEVGDVRRAVIDLVPRSTDAIVLDIDNGPDFLVHEANAAVYEAPFIATCATKLRSDGHLCIWSMAESPALVAAMESSFSHVTSTSVPVRLQGRDEHYWIITGSGQR